MNIFPVRAAIIAASMCTVLFSFQAQAACKEKLAEVDARIADSELADSANPAAGAKMMRDQAATMCAQGNEATAMQILGMLDAMVPQTKTEAANQAQADADSKAPVTAAYLAGTWCAIVDQEHSQYVFAQDGTYQACIHDSVAGPYGACMQAEPISDWLARYSRATVVEQDTLVLGHKTGNYDATFKRGKCSKYGR